MPNSYFKFKQFTVFHDRCAMKVGTDAVLIGAWCPINDSCNILDIGTGSGIIALMLAQRTQANIVGIESDLNSALQAKDNINASPWCNRISIQHTSLQNYAAETPQKFDLIVSNPPYFIDSLKAPDERRTQARHNDSLTFEDLIGCCCKLLHPNGRLCVVLPTNESKIFENIANTNGLYCTKAVSVFPKPNSFAKRVLMEFGKHKTTKQLQDLTMETLVRNEYTPEFCKLTRDFYLKL